MGKIKDTGKEADVKFDPEQDIGEQVKKLIEKKKRNLEKRKVQSITSIPILHTIPDNN